MQQQGDYDQRPTSNRDQRCHPVRDRYDRRLTTNTRMNWTPGTTIFVCAIVLSWCAWIGTNRLKGFLRLSPIERTQLAEGALEFLQLAYLTGTYLPWGIAIYGLFRLKWYIVLLAMVVGFIAGLLLDIILCSALRSWLPSSRALLVLLAAVGMAIVVVFTV